jgi:hypothetical protein
VQSWQSVAQLQFLSILTASRSITHFTIRNLVKLGFHVVVVGLETAKHRRHGIEAIVSDGDGLRVLEFREGLHIEARISLCPAVIAIAVFRIVYE